MGLFSAEEPIKYEIDNKLLICMFCKNDSFYIRKEQLHSPTQSFFDVEWMGSTATCFVCGSCGFLHWFKR